MGTLVKQWDPYGHLVSTYETPDDDDWALVFRRPCGCSTSEPEE
jgi:hypothetical protein